MECRACVKLINAHGAVLTFVQVAGDDPRVHKVCGR